MLAGCSAVPTTPEAPDVAASPWAVESGQRGAPARPAGAARWNHLTFPGKSPTHFRYARKDGRDAVAVLAASSASMLRSRIRVEPADLGSVRFSWNVPELIAGADMALREADDSPVRIVLVFEGDRSKFSAADSMLSELVRTVTGEELPYATLMYVWCNTCQKESVIVNPRTDRIRKLAVEAGTEHLGQWRSYQRNIRADFEKVFGEAPGTLLGLAIMTDTDNTRSSARAWYGAIRLD